MRLLLALAAACLLALPGAHAWVAGPTKPHHADLAVLAAERLPPAERGLLMRNLESFRQGAMDPDGISNPDRAIHTFYHAYEAHDGGGGGVYRIQLSLYEAAMALRKGLPEADVAYQMGILTHFTLDLSVPFHTGSDDYDHRWHEPYEIAAYDHRAEFDVRPGGPVREVEDPEARAVELAHASAALSDPLIASLDAAGRPWTPEAARITGEAASLGVAATADYLHTAFLWADPARPDPVPAHTEEMPVPMDAEDLGLSITELAKHHPTLLASGVFALAAAVVSVAAWLFGSRRRDARG